VVVTVTVACEADDPFGVTDVGETAQVVSAGAPLHVSEIG
jgi:hypothetical protein